MMKNVRSIFLAILCLVSGGLLSQHSQIGGAEEAKGPHWMYGLGLKVRKGSETEFSKQTTKLGVEVFRDENNNNLIYISETGAIAVVPAR